MNYFGDHPEAPQSNGPRDPEVVAAAVVQDGRILLVRRRVPEGGLLWQLPAGKIKPRELLAEAAERETLEETGLRVATLNYLGQRVHPMTRRMIAYVGCEVVFGEARVAAPAEISEVAWCPVGDIMTYIPGGLYPPVQAYVESRAD